MTNIILCAYLTHKVQFHGITIKPGSVSTCSCVDTLAKSLSDCYTQMFGLRRNTHHQYSFRGRLSTAAV